VTVGKAILYNFVRQRYNESPAYGDQVRFLHDNIVPRYVNVRPREWAHGRSYRVGEIAAHDAREAGRRAHRRDLPKSAREAAAA
jgi:hypothetical protein